MKILIVSQYYYPEQFQINEIAPELVKRGHTVAVLTGLPNYPKGDVFDGYRHGENRDEMINGVRVIRCSIHSRKQGAFHLLMNYLSFASNATRLAASLKDEYDLVFCYQLSPITVLKPAISYAKKHKIPLLCYCLDIWPESAQSHVKNDKGLLYRYISRISKKYYSSCDHIAVTSRPFKDYLALKNGIATDKINYLPQHADDSYLSMNLVAQKNTVTNFMYAGNMGAGQTLDIMIKAAAKIKDKNFLLHFVGDGSKRAELEKLAAELGIESKVIFYGNQKRDDMPNFYRKADALLITLRGNNFVGNTVPGKLQVYMTTGKPIFGAINGATREIIGESCCGATVAAGDIEGLASLMEEYINHPEKYADCGENAKKYFAERFTLKTYMDTLESELTRTNQDYAGKVEETKSCSLKK